MRVFAGDEKFQALSALTFACNLTRVKNVVKRVTGRNDGSAWSAAAAAAAAAAAGGDGRGKALVAVAVTDAVLAGAAKGRAPQVARAVAEALDALEAKVPILFSPFIRLFGVPTALVHVTPRVLAFAAPGVLRSMRFYGHLLPVVAGYVRCMVWLYKLNPVDP